MSDLSSITSAQLKRAADIKDKIETLNKELAGIFGSSSATKSPGPKPKRTMSAAGRASVAAAQKARWAKLKGAKANVKPVAERGNKMSAEGRAKIAAAAKAKWAKAKAAGKKSL